MSAVREQGRSQTFSTRVARSPLFPVLVTGLYEKVRCIRVQLMFSIHTLRRSLLIALQLVSEDATCMTAALHTTRCPLSSHHIDRYSNVFVAWSSFSYVACTFACLSAHWGRRSHTTID